MNRTRRWKFVQQEVIGLVKRGLSVEEIAERLDLGRATVYRWKKQGKLRVDGDSRPRKPVVEPRPGQTPEQWEAEQHAEFLLNGSDEQMVAMGRECLATFQDKTKSDAVRFQAMREFRATVKQLGLVTRPAKGEQASPTPEDKPAARQTFPAQARSGGDPRGVLEAVK